MPYVQVALDVPLPQLFDYVATDVVPDDVGRCVRVPFARGEKTGVIWGLAAQSTQTPETLRPVRHIFRELPPLPAHFLELCAFCAAYYHYPLGQVLAFALPPLLRRGKLPTRQHKYVGMGDKPFVSPPLPELRSEQAAALAAILASQGQQRTWLLHGITGSGKTEVYMQAIAAVCAQAGQALMLVPEIALTPQLEARVRARFPDRRVLTVHSGLGEVARARAFIAALEGKVDIVLGTRLAVFMPLPRLALIVVDEEHDPSFKQQERLRYHARDVAVLRARQQGVPVVLGSATPSLESWYNAQPEARRDYQLLTLTRRAHASADLPCVRVINTHGEKLADGLSSALRKALAACLARGEQSLLFLNRRGYAPVLACPACAWISRCPRCSANRVVHLVDKRLRCHHCGLEAAIPQSCPDCGNQDIHPFGRGTQRLEAALQRDFPQARVLRIDRDSANSPKKWEALLRAIHAGEVDILVGTQMLAKGHDFPRITLVGVVGADASLFSGDFRAPERLFAQLMQVGGRSGRADLPGEVLVQTEYPQLPLYQALCEHDFAAFAKAQLAERKAAGFPPYARHALLRAEAPAMADAVAFLTQAKGLAQPWITPALCLYDPVPMRLQRLMNWERAQLLVEAVHRAPLQTFLASWLPLLRAQKCAARLRWHLDVDPQES